MKVHIFNFSYFVSISLLMHLNLAITNNRNENKRPCLLGITELYRVHGHHLAVLANALEHLLLVAVFEGRSLVAMVYHILIAHVEYVLHYVR